MARVRVIGLALLILAVPSLAFGGEEAPSEPATLSVNAVLAGCGLANAQVTCQIDASWNGLEGADYYTVSVARPDGVVLDLGQSAGTSRAIFVPYVGPGRYSVQVSAWGTPPGEDELEVVARDRSTSTDGRAATRTSASRVDPRVAADDEREPNEAAASAASKPGAASEPTATELPACEEPEADPAEDETDETAVAVTSETEQYDPADADGDDGCALDPSP